MPSTLFTARLLGYLVGLVPLGVLLLLFRQTIPQPIGLGLVAAGFMGSIWLQQRARARFPYNFKDRAEWLALGIYAVSVSAILLAFNTL